MAACALGQGLRQAPHTRDGLPEGSASLSQNTGPLVRGGVSFPFTSLPACL